MTITPEAQEWLDRGGTNRKITRRRIYAITAAIVRGEWQLTGEAIKLADWCAWLAEQLELATQCQGLFEKHRRTVGVSFTDSQEPKVEQG